MSIAGSTDTQGSMTLRVVERLKKRALRTGAWFRHLKQTERAIVDLVLRLKLRVKSSRLALIISRIAVKLARLLPKPLHQRIAALGKEWAERSVNVALSWGNVSAISWLESKAYVIWNGMLAHSLRFLVPLGSS